MICIPCVSNYSHSKNMSQTLGTSVFGCAGYYLIILYLLLSAEKMQTRNNPANWILLTEKEVFVLFCQVKFQCQSLAIVHNSTLHWHLEVHMVSTIAKQITAWTKSSEKEWERKDESSKSVCKLCIICAYNVQRNNKFRGFNTKAQSWHLTFLKLIIILGVKMKGKKANK